MNVFSKCKGASQMQSRLLIYVAATAVVTSSGTCRFPNYNTKQQYSHALALAAINDQITICGRGHEHTFTRRQ